MDSVIPNVRYVSMTTSLSMSSSFASDITVTTVYSFMMTFVTVTRFLRTLVAVLTHYCFARCSVQAVLPSPIKVIFLLQGQMQLEVHD